MRVLVLMLTLFYSYETPGHPMPPTPQLDAEGEEVVAWSTPKKGRSQTT